MRRFMPLLLAIGLALSTGVASPRTAGADDSGVPTTVHGGSRMFKEGGREMVAGFRGVGRGIKDVFTGHRSKEDFEEGRKIGSGAAGVGKGIAGMGRGVGRGIKRGFEENERSSAGD